ncbi:MAG: sugar transferase [Bacteroidetes bacterium]|nr:sugar transferase [Bacteroidota bacterium]
MKLKKENRMTHIYSKIRDYRLNNKGRAKGFIDLVELILVSLTYPLSIWIARTLFIPELDVKVFEGILFFAFILISWFVLARVTAMAKIPRTQRFMTMAFQFVRAAFIILVALLAVKVIFRLISLPVLFIVIYVTIMFGVTVLFRLLAFLALRTYRYYGRSSHQVMIIADAFSDGVIENLLKQREWGFKITSIMTDSKLIKAKYGPEIEIVPSGQDVKWVIDHQIIDEVMYCKRDVDVDLIKEMGDICNEVGVIFRFQSSVSPLDPTEFQLKTLNKSGDLSIVDAPSNSLSLILKTMGDIYFSILAIVMLLPVFLSLGLIIKIGSKGPVFFKQERIGLRGRKFKLFKFRTMVVDAEAQLKKLQAMNEADGPVFKIRDDPRITRVGRFLRKTGLDELPQLFNVIRGEMSLIGPRPPLEDEVNQYERWQLRRLSVKPGITCTWQIVPDRHDVSFEKWMELDLHYIDNWNLFKDLGLFFKTVKTFFMAGGH